MITLTHLRKVGPLQLAKLANRPNGHPISPLTLSGRQHRRKTRQCHRVNRLVILFLLDLNVCSTVRNLRAFYLRFGFGFTRHQAQHGVAGFGVERTIALVDSQSQLFVPRKQWH